MTDYKITPDELANILKKHPGKIPLYITKANNSTTPIPDIKKHKFLVPEEFTMANIQHTIRLWLKLKPEEAIFLFINNSIPPHGVSMIELYQRYMSRDGLLRITYTSENTFG